MREYFLNADFDATLRGVPSLLETAENSYIHEMAWHYLFAAREPDRIILHSPLPQDFIGYLSNKGLPIPHTTLHPNWCTEATFTPFGWNAHTVGLRQRYTNQPDFPDLSVVKKANSRAFSYALEHALHPPEESGGLFQSWTELKSFLDAHPRPGGWMLKGDHGYAGTANKRIPAGPINDAEQKILMQIFTDHGQAVLEPWQDRLIDLAVNFNVKPGGGIKDFCGHELFNSQDGTFLGVKLSSNRLPPEPWLEPLRATAVALGLALDQLGYFGPVSLDAYVWRSEKGPQLRSMVDVNARQSMALPIHGLGHRLPGKILLWTWMKPSKLSLPENYAQLDLNLGTGAFNADTQSGILPISPIWLADKKGKAKRIGFLFSADGEEELADLRQKFKLALGKH